MPLCKSERQGQMVPGKRRRFWLQTLEVHGTVGMTCVKGERVRKVGCDER